jgi:hypothetical protein
VAKLPEEIYSLDVRSAGSARPTAVAELEFWWSGRCATTDAARARFLAFLAAQGLAPAPSARVAVDLVDEFRLLTWVIRAEVVELRAASDR